MSVIMSWEKHVLGKVKGICNGKEFISIIIDALFSDINYVFAFGGQYIVMHKVDGLVPIYNSRLEQAFVTT